MIGIMDRLLGGGLRQETTLNPDDDRFYRGSGVGLASHSGRIVSPDSAMRVTAVFRCVSILSQTLASLPLHVFKRLGPGGGKDRAVQNPLYYVLHDRPNGWQTSYDFRAMLMAHLCLRGNAYAEMLPGPRGPVDQLIPLHPDRVIPEVIRDGSSYRMRYRVSEFGTGEIRVLTQDEVFHIRGLSSDGFVGLSPIAAAREAVGLSLATEEHGARTFGNGARPGGVLTSEKPLSPEAKVRLKDSWTQTQAGLENAGKTAVLSDGLKWQQIGMSNEDSQFLDTRKFQVEEIARLFGIPPHLLMATDKSTSWGAGIEQQTLGFVIFTLRPWLVAWEQAISRDMIVAPQSYFAEFSVDALMRGDSAARSAFYAVMVQNGLLSPNEIRDLEGRNARPGGDEFLTPLNMSTGAPAAPAAPSGDGETAP